MSPTEHDVRAVLECLTATYHGRGSVELGDPYKVLIATVISQRTREEDTSRISDLVFAKHPDAKSLAKANVDGLTDMLSGSMYPEVKAPRLIEIAKILTEKYRGKVPDSIDSLLELPGVGRKTANCVLIYAFEKPALCIDTHFHRITNRLGWVTTKNPEQTEIKLEKIIPRELWVGTNRLFLQHGRAICVPTVPLCSKCPIIRYCDYGRSESTPKR